MGKVDGNSDLIGELSEAEWGELVVLVPYLSWAQNCWGPTGDRNDSLDYSTLTSGHFDRFYIHHNDVNKRNHYKVEETRENRSRRRKDEEEKQAAIH